MEQASTRLQDTCERSVFENGRKWATWFTDKLQIEQSEVMNEVVIKEEGRVTMTGVLVESIGSSVERTIYLTGDSSLEMKEALVILLDLCIECLNCQHLAFAVDRHKATSILNDLRWVGFELINPDLLVKDKSILDNHVFVGIEL